MLLAFVIVLVVTGETVTNLMNEQRQHETSE
jgi:hypothetical protein